MRSPTDPLVTGLVLGAGGSRRLGRPKQLVDRIDVPAGIDIGARTPAEIAVSILAKIVAVRRAAHPRTLSAVDPVCGMSVAVAASTLSLEQGDETLFFCSEGCLAEFERRGEHAVAD